MNLWEIILGLLLAGPRKFSYRTAYIRNQQEGNSEKRKEVMEVKDASTSVLY